MTTARRHRPSKSLSELEALRRLFTIAIAREIVQRVGAPPRLDEDTLLIDVEASPEDMLFAHLARQLNEAAAWWGIEEREQTSASPAMKALLADRVAAKCAALLTVATDPDGKLLDSLGPGGLWAQAKAGGAVSGKDQVAEALAAIMDLQRWATAMAERARRENTAASSGRQPDEAFSHLLGRLGTIFFSFWRRSPGLARPDQSRPGGPFFRFVAAVMDELDVSRTDEALATAISRNPELKALREVIGWNGTVGD